MKEIIRKIIPDKLIRIYRLIKNDVYITDVFDCRQNPQKMKSVK